MKQPLSKTHPELAKEWHPDKNCGIAPNAVTSGSGKKVWWRCSFDSSHEWEARVYSRTKGSGCPICAGQQTDSATSLAAIRPDLVAEWDFAKNGDLTPADVRPGSNKVVWWRCAVDPTHEWLAQIAARAKGQKACPKCTSLGVKYPHLVAEWHPRRNVDLTPYDVRPGSDEVVWWRCSRDPTHEWKARVANRVHGRGCPMCAGRSVTPTTSLRAVHPRLAKEWHNEKNGNLTPDDVTPGSGKTVWWRCSVEPSHEWPAKILNRANGTGCPICAGTVVTSTTSLRALRPDLAAEWNSEKNGALTPDDVTPGSNKKVWWRCSQDASHHWLSMVNNRSKGNGCPICSGQSVTPTTCLQAVRPDLAAEWNHQKNGDLTPESVGAGSGRTVWWRCSVDQSHEWRAAIYSRSKGRGCPMCSGRVATPKTSLRAVRPDVAAEWHKTRNGAVTPDDVTPRSGKKVWWQCEVDPTHEWQATVSGRTGGSGCPICTGQIPSPTTSLRALYPDLAAEWHPEKNGNLTPDDVRPGSGQIVWWVCSVDSSHEWKTKILHRSRGSGCPMCSGLVATATTSLRALHPHIAAEWHPQKNQALTADNIRPGSDKKVWWRCSRNPSHEWQATVLNRVKGSGCPVCTLAPRSRDEIFLACELQAFFDFDLDDHKLNVAGKWFDVDIIIQELGLVIEFDGSYWHQNKHEVDRQKSQQLTRLGWKVIRVREEPLQVTGPNDVVVPQRDFKSMVDSVLLQIKKVCGQEPKDLDEYLQRSSLINARKAELLIWELLEKRASAAPLNSESRAQKWLW